MKQGQTAQKEGNTALAMSRYASAIKKDSTYLPAYDSRARLYLQLKQYDKALTDFLFIKEHKNIYPGLYGNLAEIYTAKGEYKKAADAYD